MSRWVFLLVLICSLLAWRAPAQALEAKKNVLILFSNEHTQFYPAHLGQSNYDNSRDYEGYFDSRKYYEYDANKVFVPVGKTYDHYVPVAGEYWSGNFLNWMTMSNADLVRKAMTGGRRSIDAQSQTVLERADIMADGSHDWRKNYAGVDLPRLVPMAYANVLYSFHNSERHFVVIDGSGRTVDKPYEVSVEVCNSQFPENNCTGYPKAVYKPAGYLQRNTRVYNFGLMTHSLDPEQTASGGLLRVPLGSVEGEFNADSGKLNPGNGIINLINADDYRGWGPLAEMYYDALRYLQGNEAAQAAYCGEEMLKDGGYPVYGCDARQPWVDPITDPCQRQEILIIGDEYPSKDYDELPGSAFNSGYVDTPMNFGANRPFNPDVSVLTDRVADAEGITNTIQTVGVSTPYISGGNLYQSFSCKLQVVTNLSQVIGICPSEASGYGSYYLAGLAHDAFTGDLRPDLPGRQKVSTQALIYRGSPGGYQYPMPPMNPLWLAVKFGNFDDRNKNGLPDLGEFGPLPYTLEGDVWGLLYVDDLARIREGFSQSDDVDQDGICDAVDDSDGDGIFDGDDICPYDPTNTIDVNGLCGKRLP